MKTIWPEEVPILGTEDMCHNDMQVGEKACILGWIIRSFPMGGFFAVEDSIEAAIKEMDPDFDFTSWMPIATWNDTHNLDQCAKLWNKAMSKLGYAEEC